MSTAQIEGMLWNSFAYESTHAVDGLTGPDKNTRCETPRHTFGEVKPEAVWVELLWFPETSTVARCWKTCEDCHVGMAQVAERNAE